MTTRTLTALALSFFALACFAADAKKPAIAIIDPAVAAKDPDFAIQGEYTGDIEGKKIGVQIIALGDGKFHGVGYKGGLPGDGWDGSAKDDGDGQRGPDGAVTMTHKDGRKATIKDGVLTAFNPDGSKAGEIKRIVRQSPTMGAKAPEGAKILFDGKTNDFKAKNGKPNPGGENELGTEGTGGQNSQTTYQSATLHVEFLLSYMPNARGQGRSNSGVYLQGRYEIQVLDSFGLKGENNECGGIYTIAKPLVNMCLPPLQWQTYDVDYTAAVFENGKKVKNATITVKHNGVLIHDKVELTKNTTAAPVKEGPEPSYLHLQDHGNPVHYRNVWIVEKK